MAADDSVRCDQDDANNDDSPKKKLSVSDLETTTPLADLARTFEVDGFLTLSRLLSPEFTAELREECMGIFEGVLEWLHAKGDVEFEESYRRSRRKAKAASSEPPETTDDGIGGKKASNDDDDEAPVGKYEYPLGVGLKNGYQELVMRSPGRYELALLTAGNNLAREISDGGTVGGCSVDDDDRDGQQLLTAAMLKHAKERAMMRNSLPMIEVTEAKSPAKSGLLGQIDPGNDNGCLKQLLEWVRNGSGNGENDHEGSRTRKQEDRSTDQKNVQTFMELVGTILPASDGDDDAARSQGGGNDGPGDARNRNDDYYLCNFSLLVSTPGCPTQPWHADGGHTSVSEHLPCHVFNVFVPLVDVPLTMGPTELRPGTHRHTRNLAPMMLAARARRTLRPPVTPVLQRGGGLVFDYRILHRGRANLSDEVAAADLDLRDADDNADDVGQHGEKDRCMEGKHRPVLVLTFSRKWFVDVCNFPKNSIFKLDESR